MSDPTSLHVIAAVIFAVAILHTFVAAQFSKLAHRYPTHGGAFHLLGEVEAVFGFWAFVLVVVMASQIGLDDATTYVESRNFTEPMFVFAVMVTAASRPIRDLAAVIIGRLAGLLPLPGAIGLVFVALSVGPLLGSFITEPAAMTLCALLLYDRIFKQAISLRLKYAIVGCLFVNISIGGVLTPFAAPPVVMVAGKWGWDIAFMLEHYGWKAVASCVVSATVLVLLFRRELGQLAVQKASDIALTVPVWAVGVHLLFLAGLVVFAHYAAVFMGLFLLFLGFCQAYPQFQSRLLLREGLMVGFFLAGLVTLGGLQTWWLQPLLLSLTPTQVYFVATALTAITDNAAITYLASLVEGLSDEFKFQVVAGAVTGGGLTVIANAPNPAGYAILKGRFPDEAIAPHWLFLAALPPTLVVIAAFELLPY